MSNDPVFPRLTRRDALRLFGAYAGVTVLAACTPIGSPSAAPTTAAQKAGEASKAAPVPTALQPRVGGTLRIATTAESPALEPHILGRGHVATPYVHNLLTRYDNKTQPQPELAESWDLSSDAKQLKLNLRKGVQFHTGREFTAEDVKYNILRVRDPKVGVAQLAGQSKWITDIEVPDKYAMVLKFDGPRPAIFDFFENLYISDKETLEGPDAAQKVVGTGPFKFVEWLPKDRVRVVKNKDYWRSGRPYLDEILWLSQGDEQAMIVQFEAGAVDLATPVSAREATRLKKDPKYIVDDADMSSGYYYLAANTTLPPTNNKKFRQALNYALDRKRFVDSVLLGLGQPSALPWPSTSSAYEATKASAYSFDLDKAASLIKESGLSNIELDFVYISTATPIASLAQIYQSDLAKIGVKLNLKGLEEMRYREQVDNVKYQGVCGGSSGFANLDPSSLLALSRWWSTTNSGTGLKSEKYNELVKAVSTESDQAKRKKSFADLNDFILDESAIMAISAVANASAMRANVHGVTRGGSATLILDDAWIG